MQTKIYINAFILYNKQIIKYKIYGFTYIKYINNCAYRKNKKNALYIYDYKDILLFVGWSVI
jgi:hypothetical protein